VATDGQHELLTDAVLTFTAGQRGLRALAVQTVGDLAQVVGVRVEVSVEQ
jgi:hypothetical protein